MLTRTIFFVMALTVTTRFCTAQEHEHLQKLNGSDKHPQYKVDDNDDRLTKLHKRRINAALGSWELVQLMVEEGHFDSDRFDISQCNTVQNRLLDVQLVFHKSKPEKVNVLTEALERAQKIEKRLMQFSEAQLINPFTVNAASVHRIDIEIRLGELKSLK